MTSERALPRQGLGRGPAQRGVGRAWQLVAATLLALYCALLCFAAVPKLLMPRELRPVHRAARLALWDGLRVKAGEEVFVGEAPDRKQRLICLLAFGVNDGQPQTQKRGYESFPSCKPPAVRLRSSPFELALNASAWLLFTQRGDFEPAVAAGASDERMRGIARYFCASPHSAIRGFDAVVLVLQNQRQDFYTGAITERLAVIHEHACKRGVSVPAERFAFEADKLGSGSVVLRSATP